MTRAFEAIIVRQTVSLRRLVILQAELNEPMQTNSLLYGALVTVSLVQAGALVSKLVAWNPVARQPV